MECYSTKGAVGDDLQFVDLAPFVQETTDTATQYDMDLGPNKGSLLPKILFITTRIIQKDAEEKKVSFSTRPYLRLFVNLLSELSTADLHDGASFQYGKQTGTEQLVQQEEIREIDGVRFRFMGFITIRDGRITCDSP